jgi:ATP-dependent RNA helicase DDX60
MDRVQRLMLSNLPSLGGHFPLTSTLCLRLFNLLEGSNHEPVAIKAVQSIMKLPQISFTSEIGHNQLLHHLRFSIDYLRRAQLLDEHGKPMNLFGIAGHLYYTEPSNLAMVVLLRNGVLHKIATQESLVNAKRDFVLLMAHLFGRRYLPKLYSTRENIKMVTRKSPSMIVLPPLQEHACHVLMNHDHDILRIFTAYALTFVTHNAIHLGQDHFLPLSQLEFAGTSCKQDSIFQNHLHNTSTHVVVRSSFAANSGHGDVFRSVGELAHTARQGLHLNEYAIPSMAYLTETPSDEEGSFMLNAYLLDFYIHGQVAALAVANGIRRGDVWYALQDFVLSLMTIRGALEQLLSKASDDMVEEEEADVLDRGNASLDPAELDGDDADGEHSFQRQHWVSDQDWRLYQVVSFH